MIDTCALMMIIKGVIRQRQVEREKKEKETAGVLGQDVYFPTLLNVWFENTTNPTQARMCVCVCT